MRKKFISVLIIIFLVCTIFAVLTEHNSSTQKISTTQKSFDSFTNSVFTSEVSGNAFNLHFYLKNPNLYNIKNVPTIIGSINYDEMKDSEDYYLDLINKLKSYDYNELSDDGKLTYDIFMHYASTELAFSDLCLNYQPLSPTVGIQAQLPVLLSQYTFNDEHDATTYIKLLYSTQNYFNQILEFEKIKSEKGYFMSQNTLEDIIAQCTNFVESDNSFLIDTFNERIQNLPQLNKKQKDKYMADNKDAVENHFIPAYKMLIDGLSALRKNCQKNLGLCYYTDGKNYYNYLVRSYTGSSRSIAEIEEMIQKKLNTDLAVLFSLSKDTDVYKALYDNSKESQIQEPENILKELTKQIKEDFPETASTEYTVSYVPESLEEHLSPAFYLSPPIDDPDNNRIFINNNDGFSETDLFVTLAHEGYPGHLYQTTYFNNTDPSLIRHLLDFGGYTEGWATYVEFYSYSYKYNNEKIVKALCSSASYSLALYCLADIGINYHGWSYEETRQFFTSHGIDDESVVKDIFDKMISEPANYLQYYVGYLEILELKDKMKKMRGSNYSDLEFHTYILNIGPAPFEIIEKYMNRAPLGTQ